MTRSFWIVHSECCEADPYFRGRYMIVTNRGERRPCGCYTDSLKAFCRRDFEGITGVSLPLDQPTEFRLVRVDDEPRRGWLRRLWDWLFQEGGPGL